MYAKHLWKLEVRHEAPFPVTSTAAQLCPPHHHPAALSCKPAPKTIEFPQREAQKSPSDTACGQVSTTVSFSTIYSQSLKGSCTLWDLQQNEPAKSQNESFIKKQDVICFHWIHFFVHNVSRVHPLLGYSWMKKYLASFQHIKLTYTQESFNRSLALDNFFHTSLCGSMLRTLNTLIICFNLWLRLYVNQ